MKNLLRSPLGFLLALALLATGCQQAAKTPTAESPTSEDTAMSNADTKPSPEASPADVASGDAPAGNASSPQAPAAETKNEYPQAFIDAFMQGCTGSGAPETYCKCSIDKIQTEFTKEEFEELDRLAREQKEIPAPDQDKLNEIVQACR